MGDALCKQVNCDALGISIQIVSTFLAALAYVLQKKAHLRVQALAGEGKAAAAGEAAAGSGAAAHGGGEAGDGVSEGWSASRRGWHVGACACARLRCGSAGACASPLFLSPFRTNDRASPRSLRPRRALAGSGAGGSA